MNEPIQDERWVPCDEFVNPTDIPRLVAEADATRYTLKHKAALKPKL